MHRAVNDEARGIDEVGRLHHDVSREIHFHETRRRDLFKQESVRIDEKVMPGSGHAHRDVREDEIVPVIQRRQTIERCKIDTRLPLRL